MQGVELAGDCAYECDGAVRSGGAALLGGSARGRTTERWLRRVGRELLVASRGGGDSLVEVCQGEEDRD